MKVKGLNGRVYDIKVSDYLIDWDRKVSGPQKAVKDFLQPYWKNAVVTEECAIHTGKGRPMRVDLINWTRRIVVEVSPQSSHSWNKWFHKDRARFGAAVKRDLDKAEWAALNRFTYCELSEEDIALLTPKWWKATFGIPL